MKRVFAVMLIATACVVGSTPSFAVGGVVHLLAHRDDGFVRNPTALLGASPPPSPTFDNRIPAPLAAPVPAPVINGPAARSPYGGVM
jgi:hypothetical protein